LFLSFCLLTVSNKIKYFEQSEKIKKFLEKFETTLNVSNKIKCFKQSKKLRKKFIFLPSNYYTSLILAIQLRNRVSLIIQLSKPVRFGHPCGFEFADVDAT